MIKRVSIRQNRSMERNNKIYISPKYTNEDYNKLITDNNYDQVFFEKAVNIFDDRIRGRYIDPINLLSNSENIEKYGFAVMALDCLLIETLAQFRKGLKNTKGISKKEYVGFLEECIHMENSEAEEFYNKIRCGILHSAQTYNGARLSMNGKKIIENNKGTLIVSFDKMTESIISYFGDYKKKLVNGCDVELRNNFVKKMNYVCRRDS